MQLLNKGLFATIAFLGAANALAQTKIETNPGSGNVLYVRNSGTQAADGVGLRVESSPLPYYGFGVLAEGGYTGVRGLALKAGTGSRYGGTFMGSNGTGSNYGVNASASGGATAYGIFASANGATGANYAGYFAGNVYVSGTFTNPSDSRLKRDIRSLDGALDRVKSLRPTTYFFDNSKIPMKGLPQSRQIGLIAEDVKASMPELVVDVPVADTGSAKGGTEPIQTIQSVNYIGLIPVLVGAIKEQQIQIDALKAALAAKK